MILLFLQNLRPTKNSSRPSCCRNRWPGYRSHWLGEAPMLPYSLGSPPHQLLLKHNLFVSSLKTIFQPSGQLLPLKVRKLQTIVRRIPPVDRIEINNAIKRPSVAKTPSNCYRTIPFKKCNLPESLIPQKCTVRKKEKG